MRKLCLEQALVALFKLKQTLFAPELVFQHV